MFKLTCRYTHQGVFVADKGNVFITGAATGIGAATTDQLVRSGYRVFAGVHQQSGSLAGARGIRTVPIDVTDPAGVLAAAKDVQEEVGSQGLRAVINNAGVIVQGPLELVPPDELRRQFEINTLGPFVCCHHAGLIMMEQERGGAIVNIGDWAIERPYRDYSAYFASKGGIPTLTRVFAVELAPKVRVNAVLPGPVLLPESVSEAERRRAIAGTLLQRAGRPENIAHAVAALLENDFITGVCLPVDGGRTLGDTA